MTYVLTQRKQTEGFIWAQLTAVRCACTNYMYDLLNAPEGGGAHTAHTQVGRPTHEAPTREYTHKHPQTQTNHELILKTGFSPSRHFLNE